MKKRLHILIAAMSLLPLASFGAAKPNDKFAIVVAKDNKIEDCKISIKEMNNYKRGQPGQRYICVEVTDMQPNEIHPEATPPRLLKEMANPNSKYEFSYEGLDSDGLIETLNTWIKFLAEKKAKPEVASWSANLKNESDGIATVVFIDSSNNSSFEISVKLGVDID